jgi:hypothetical protein
MKQLLDFLPILLFFGAYKLYGIYVATAVLMAATVVHTLYIYKTEGRLLTMQKVTLWLVLGFGALTLLLQDERFIKIKPTILYAGRRARIAYRGLAQSHDRVDWLQHLHGLDQRLCGLFLDDRAVDQFQALGLRFSDHVPDSSRLLHCQTFAQG